MLDLLSSINVLWGTSLTQMVIVHSSTSCYKTLTALKYIFYIVIFHFLFTFIKDTQGYNIPQVQVQVYQRAVKL